MKSSFAFVLMLLITGCALAAKQSARPGGDDLMVSGFPDLPSDARRVVERLAACSHFSGEFNGNRPERDKEVSAAMTELRCETIDHDASVMRHRYAGDRSVQDALAAASQM